MTPYNMIISEYFDMSDTETIRTMTSLNEAEQDQALVNLASRLYTAIVNKITDIDFGKIPNSKGDITSIPNFMETKQCLETINDLLVKYKQPTTPTDTVLTAINNLKDNRRLFEKAFYTNSDFGIMYYNTIALSIITATSLLISASVELIKDPGIETYEVFLDKLSVSKSKESLLFKDLTKFNELCKKGDMQKILNATNSSTKMMKEADILPFDETAIMEVVALPILGILGKIGMYSVVIFALPLLHELVSILYSIKQSVSDYFAVQAQLIELNTETLKYSYAHSPEEKEKIINRQIKIANKFKSIANKLAVKIKTGEKKAKEEIEKDKNKKLKASDVVKQAPASSIF